VLATQVLIRMQVLIATQRMEIKAAMQSHTKEGPKGTSQNPIT